MNYQPQKRKIWKLTLALKRNFNESEQKKVKTFYCPGGFNYEKMSTPSKLMMKMSHRQRSLRSRTAKKGSTMVSHDTSPEIFPLFFYRSHPCRFSHPRSASCSGKGVNSMPSIQFSYKNCLISAMSLDS